MCQVITNRGDETRPQTQAQTHVTFIERFVHYFWPQVSWTHVLISNSWHAWLGIVDQNWLKLALAKLALGQPISLKVVGMAIPVKITVRSKFPFICMKYSTNPVNPTGNLIPLTLDSIVKPQISYFLPILVQNRSTWPTHAQVLSRVDWSMGHVPSDLTRAPKGQHEILLSPSF